VAATGRPNHQQPVRRNRRFGVEPRSPPVVTGFTPMRFIWRLEDVAIPCGPWLGGGPRIRISCAAPPLETECPDQAENDPTTRHRPERSQPLLPGPGGELGGFPGQRGRVILKSRSACLGRARGKRFVTPVRPGGDRADHFAESAGIGVERHRTEVAPVYQSRR